MGMRKVSIGSGYLSMSASEGVTWLFNPQEIGPAMRRANRAALSSMGNIIIEDTQPYVPKFTGLLRASAEVDVERSSSTNAELSINYSRPIYNEATWVTQEIAHLLYRGYVPNQRGLRTVKNWTEPGTGPEWFKVALENHGDEWINKFSRDFKDSFVQHK